MSLNKTRYPALLSRLRQPGIFAAALVVTAAAIAYLPGLLQATVYRDDWYYLLDRLIGGPGIFQAMFSIDRPARGPFFEFYFQLFGITPLPYHLVSFMWRAASGLAALWLFRQLWPAQPRATVWMALLFVLFPGYLRWMEGFEDQPGAASLFLETLSIALTIKAISSRGRAVQVFAWAASIITGWAYLALVDFAFGMEGFRFLCVLVLVNRSTPALTAAKRVAAGIRTWALAAIIPVGFLFWRLFIFHDIRHQTDVGIQLGAVLTSPVPTLSAWLVSFVQSVVDVAAFAWVTPVVQQFFGLRPRYLLLGGLLAALTVLCLYMADRATREPAPEDDLAARGSTTGTSCEAMAIGGLGVMVGVMPVVLANRHVDFQSFSHYALPSSLASAVLLVGYLLLLSSRRAQLVSMALLASCAVVVHFTYSSQVLNEERTIGAFWQQVAWRAPSLAAGTTLFVNYPDVTYGDNLDAARGPANLIYFPEPKGTIPVTYQIAALRQEPGTTQDVLAGKDIEGARRTHVQTQRFHQLLVLSQPTKTSCIHAIDATSLVFSAADPDQVRVVGEYSNAAGTIGRRGSPTLVSFIFGTEPARGWCYYFEQADLARQYADWQEIARLNKEIAAQGLHPEDAIEWTPFLQAYAALGDAGGFTSTARRLAIDPYARKQACNLVHNMQASGSVVSPEIGGQADGLLCRGQ